MKNTDKIQFLVILQAFAIICVFVGHATHIFSSWGWYGHNAEVNSICNTIHHIVYSFHMPLFVFLSGYLFGYKKDETFNYMKYIAKRFNRLIIPLLGVGILYYIPFLIIINPFGHTPYESIKNFFTLQFNGHLWFLISLFIITLLILPLTTKWLRKLPQIFILGGLIVLSLLKIKGIPHSIFMALKLAVYFYLGYLFATKKELLEKFISFKLTLPIISILWIVSEIINFQNFGDIYYGFVTATISIILLFIVFKKLSLLNPEIDKNYIIKFLSTNMFALYLIHEPIMVSILKALGWGNIYSPIITALILFIGTLISTSIIILMINITKHLIKDKNAKNNHNH